MSYRFSEAPHPPQPGVGTADRQWQHFLGLKCLLDVDLAIPVTSALLEPTWWEGDGPRPLSPRHVRSRGRRR